MINPEEKPNWRPKTDLGRHDVAGLDEPPYMPKSREDAVMFIKSLALPEVEGYAGYPEVQEDVAMTLAAANFPKLFRESVTLTVVEPRSVA